MPLDNRTCFIVNLRDRLTCQSCGKMPLAEENYHRRFEYHHILPSSLGGSDRPDNIVLLCHGCHVAAHKNANIDKIPKNWDLTMPEDFPCHVCAATLDTETVGMNCGWYFCNACATRTHLFDHCLAA
jgi:hypothetical protein